MSLLVKSYKKTSNWNWRFFILHRKKTQFNQIYSDYSQQILRSRDIDYAITYNVLKVTNINDFNFELENYDPEEACTFCFLYAIVAMRYFFTESIFYCQTLNWRKISEHNINAKHIFKSMWRLTIWNNISFQLVNMMYSVWSILR